MGLKRGRRKGVKDGPWMAERDWRTVMVRWTLLEAMGSRRTNLVEVEAIIDDWLLCVLYKPY